MRKCGLNISDVKRYVLSLGDAPIKILINKGRKKTVKYSGSISATYPQVFTVSVSDNKLISSLSCSYSDLICGEVKIIKSV